MSDVSSDELSDDLTLDEVQAVLRKLDAKRKSRLWLAGEADIIEAIIEAQAALTKIAGFMVEP